ncbi:hypothetical protein FHG64_01530 [Antarcticibacterium flavum]|uniref:Peptidylprolyl isomerase n=2 Tax=Flavobacteriaceae TaxID=49546 RepID=A0A5B7X7E5_9FLAO|nr:hypothetical protein [Antarcticibacterium sp. W02-3]QCY71329.1 hypothetical protein FHG64_01530 [Antarcticibacterium flavum]
MRSIIMVLLLTLVMTGCSGTDNDDLPDPAEGIENPGENEPDPDPDPDPDTGEGAVFILIDEESIDNGNEPNNFSETDVNDQLAEVGLRQPLDYFENNIGEEIELYTGQVGDEGWFAFTAISSSWVSAGPTQLGARNFIEAGPGLGQDGSEDLLDEVPDVIPLRATGLAMLTGQTVLAVVYDSDISINYDPIEANLQGDNLGIVAFEILEVNARTGGSDSDLPVVRVLIKDAGEIAAGDLLLFSNPPIPESSSEPEDITPPSNVPDIVVIEAN